LARKPWRDLKTLRRTKMTRDIHPLFDLTGKVALVTGGGSGLGEEFCDVLAEFGADVVTCARHKDDVDETCRKIGKYGHKTLALAVDVAKYDQVQAMFRQVEDTFGRLDILITNAGVTTLGALIHEVELSEWHRLIDIDLHGVFYCMKEGLKIMMRQKKGTIINVASVLGLVGLDPRVESVVPYAAAKAAVIGMTKEAAAEYGEHGIRINCMAPGWHAGTLLGVKAGSRVSDEALAKFAEEQLNPRTPMRRLGHKSELRGLCIYLASDAASSFLTGQIIADDGGWTCI